MSSLGGFEHASALSAAKVRPTHSTKRRRDSVSAGSRVAGGALSPVTPLSPAAGDPDRELGGMVHSSFSDDIQCNERVVTHVAASRGAVRAPLEAPRARTPEPSHSPVVADDAPDADDNPDTTPC